MNKNTFTLVSNQLRRSGGELRDNPPEPHLRDVLRREEERQLQPSNEAMDKWNQMVGERIQSHLAQGGTLYRESSLDKQRDHDEPDLDLG